MAKVILICGKICSGKTTYARQFMQGRKAVLLSVDEIMLALFGQDAGEKHDEMVVKTKTYLFQKAVELIATGVNVIFDWGFWTKKERQLTTNYFQDKRIPIEWHSIDISDQIWRQNLKLRNEGILNGQDGAYYVDDDIAGKFSHMFEIPNRDEIDVWHENNRTEASD